MSSPYQQAYNSNAVLQPELPTALGGDSSKYQSTGGQGYGFDGKEIRSGVMEFSSYKTGGSRKRKQRKSKRNSKRKVRRNSKRR